MRATDLPRPACARGYTAAQVLVILGSSQQRVAEMHRWMSERGLDPVTCTDGKTDSGPHGSVIPQAALSRFLETRPH